MRRLWAWMLARPKPRQPARRIVTTSLVLFCIGFALVLRVLPARSTLRVLHVVDPILIGVAILAIAYIYIRTLMIRRKQRRRRTR